MQSLPAVSATQTLNASTSTGSTSSSNAAEGPGFAQLLSEQASRSTPTAAGEADRPAATGANPSAGPSAASSNAAGKASASASGSNTKKPAASSTHAGDSSILAASAQAAQTAAADQSAAFNSADSSNTPDPASDADANPQGPTSLPSALAASSVALSMSKSTPSTSTAPSFAQVEADGDSAPLASSAAKDDGEGEIKELNGDSKGSASATASAGLHAAASLTTSLAKAQAYLGSDSSDRAKDENNSSDAFSHLTQIGGTPSLSATVTLTTVQNSPSAGSSASTAVASANVPYQMGSDAWRADVSSHVLYFTQQNLQEAQLHLNPAHLGPLEVTIKSDNNQTSLAFSAAHEATRQAVQDSLPQLKQLFASQGVALGNTTVSDQSQGSGNTQQEAFGSRLAQSGQSALATPSVARSPIALASLSMVDTFA